MEKIIVGTVSNDSEERRKCLEILHNQFVTDPLKFAIQTTVRDRIFRKHIEFCLALHDESR